MIDFTSRPTELLGVLFDGVRASYGLSPDKFASLIARTLQLCEAGSVTMAHLRAILGSWCWALLVRRPAFSVLEHVFGQLDPLARPQRRVQPVARLCGSCFAWWIWPRCLYIMRGAALGGVRATDR